MSQNWREGVIPNGENNEFVSENKHAAANGGRTFSEAEPFKDLAPVQTALRPEQAEALLAISALLNRDLIPTRVLYGLISQLKALFHADRVGVFLRENLLIDEEGGVKNEVGPVVCAASIGLSEIFLEAIIEFYQEKEFRQLQNLRRPIFLANAQTDSQAIELRALSKQEGFCSLLTLPLLNRENLVGSLVLYHDLPNTYSSDEIRILTIFANQAALSITNARLYEEARRREDETARLSEAGRVFNSFLRVREILPHVANAAMKLLGNSVMLFVVPEGTNTATPILWDSQLEPPAGITKSSPRQTTRPIAPGEGAIGKTLESGVAFFLTNQRDILRAASFIRPEEQVLSLLCVPLKAYGKTIGVLASYQISYGLPGIEPLEKRHQNLAGQLADRAATALQNARLYEAEKREQRAKDEFLSLVSHELRTPLTSIKGYNRLLDKKLDKAEFSENSDSLRHYTQVMDGQIDRLQVLIENLTSISHIETGKLEINIVQVELAGLVRDQIELLEQQFRLARQPRIRHQFELKTLPQIIPAQADPVALGRVLQNLFSNAVKFSPKGGLIRVRVQQGSNELYIVVQDEGIGMPPEIQERVFDRFFKSNAHPNRANGLGLGLYVSRHLIEAMGGRIKVEAVEGVGSTFTLSLPRLPKVVDAV